MSWQIPAKTFLIGEYVALTGGPALLVTTSPSFELSLCEQKNIGTIHPNSPAGLWWQKHHPKQGLYWDDPYQGIGGLGASSAQFIGAYFASCQLQNKKPRLNELLDDYFTSSWSGKGVKPSGYDVIAQYEQGCVYIHRNEQIIQNLQWPFPDLSFFLIHTGAKLATHSHLEGTTLPHSLEELTSIVNLAYQAFVQNNPEHFINSINAYHQTLSKLNLVAEHSLKLINTFKSIPNVLAVKGCGALGADVIFLLTHQKMAQQLQKILAANHCKILATEQNITNNAKNT